MEGSSYNKNVANYEILAEYYSVDKILYSQLILENLFRDYKWNDIGLSKIDNSELIIQLKNFN